MVVMGGCTKGFTNCCRAICVTVPLVRPRGTGEEGRPLASEWRDSFIPIVALMAFWRGHY